ncbi:MAG: hypothetical protein JO142_00075 [Burkholderiales bacterium]|nr:hypothetical protein [Burkholderiales bacterium]
MNHMAVGFRYALPNLRVAPILFAAFALKVSAAGLCQEYESTVFSCPAGKKTISVCASKTVTPESGYVQYRFGSKENIELATPNAKTVANTVIHGYQKQGSMTGRAALMFTNNDIRYVVWEYDEKPGRGPAAHDDFGAGVKVDISGKRILSIPCTGLVTPTLLNSTVVDDGALSWPNSTPISRYITE